MWSILIVKIMKQCKSVYVYFLNSGEAFKADIYWLDVSILGVLQLIHLLTCNWSFVEHGWSSNTLIHYLQSCDWILPFMVQMSPARVIFLKMWHSLGIIDFSHRSGSQPWWRNVSERKILLYKTSKQSSCRSSCKWNSQYPDVKVRDTQRAMAGFCRSLNHTVEINAVPLWQVFVSLPEGTEYETPSVPFS